jgi:hypothetical protein
VEETEDGSIDHPHNDTTHVTGAAENRESGIPQSALETTAPGTAETGISNDGAGMSPSASQQPSGGGE